MRNHFLCGNFLQLGHLEIKFCKQMLEQVNFFEYMLCFAITIFQFIL